MKLVGRVACSLPLVAADVGEAAGLLHPNQDILRGIPAFWRSAWKTSWLRAVYFLPVWHSSGMTWAIFLNGP
jgi:hypothetical protein